MNPSVKQVRDLLDLRSIEIMTPAGKPGVGSPVDVAYGPGYPKSMRDKALVVGYIEGADTPMVVIVLLDEYDGSDRQWKIVPATALRSRPKSKEVSRGYRH